MPEATPPSKPGRPRASEYGLTEIGQALRERWDLVLVCVVAAAAGAGLLSALTQPTYTATAELLFRDPGLDDKVFGSGIVSGSGPRDLAREAETNTRLASLEIINSKTAHALGGTITEDDVEQAVEVKSDSKSDVVSIEASDGDAKRAAALANTFAAEFIEFRRQADTDTILRTQRLIDEQISKLSATAAAGAEGQRLKGHADRLRILASLQTGNAELVQPAREPTEASAPKPLRNVMLGTLCGLILGVGAALAVSRLDDRIKTPDDLEQLSNLPVIAKIQTLPNLGEKKSSRGAFVNPAEAFSFLVARLKYFNVDRQIKVMLLTSPEPTAGKSTLSWHLAAAASASPNTRVLLLEADLRRPVLAHRHGLPPGPGLTEILSTPGLRLEDVVRRSEASGRRQFDVLPAGTPPPNPIELLQSDRLKQLLDDARDTYDLVCIDTAPVGLVADAISLLRSVDGVILVARMGLTKRSNLVDTINEFERMRVPTLGLVANGVRSRGADYASYSYRPVSDEPNRMSNSPV